MNYIKTLSLFLFVCINVYPQDFEDKEQEQYLKSYIKFGYGRTSNYINVGGGIFFPLSEKFMLGIRSNVNAEIDLFKTPNESLFDIGLSVRYIPLLKNNFVTMAGVGVGYANFKKRGKFIKRQLIGLVEEYELERHKSVSAIAEIEAGFFLTKFFGISAAAYSVFTSKNNIYTYQVGLYFHGFNNP